MTATIRLTMAQALTRYLSRQMTEIDGGFEALDPWGNRVRLMAG